MGGSISDGRRRRRESRGTSSSERRGRIREDALQMPKQQQRRGPLHLALVTVAACTVATSSVLTVAVRRRRSLLVRETADTTSSASSRSLQLLSRQLPRSNFDEHRQLERERSRLEGYKIHLAANDPPPKLFHPREEESSPSQSDDRPVIMSRIVNGYRAPKRRYPWMTAVFKREPPKGENNDEDTNTTSTSRNDPTTTTTTTPPPSLSSAHLEYKCGGSLVAPNVVLTAGHCAHVAEAVQIGRRDMYDPHEHLSHPYETFAVKKVIRHPDFVNSTFANDAAILVLEGSSKAQPVVLNHPGESGMVVSEGQHMTVIGFGAVTAEGMISATLMETEVKAWSQQACLDTYKTPRRLGDFTMCANAEDTVVDEWDEDKTDYNDACQGDSGGPLVVRRSAFPPSATVETQPELEVEALARAANGGHRDRHRRRRRRLELEGMVRADDLLDVQVGIVSWGSQCGVANYPGVYARISYLYDWIARTICDVSPDYCGKTAANVVNVENDAHEEHELDSYAPPPSTTSSNNVADEGLLSEASLITEQKAPPEACKDPESFVVFEAKKNKRKTLPCSWVRENARKVCATYQVFCPAACGSCPSYKPT